MSRIGKKPIPIPSGVEVTIDGPMVIARGPRGELVRTMDATMSISRQDSEVLVTRPDDDRRSRSLHGLTRTLISNMVIGVSEGYQKSLEIVGVGYRATQQGEGLTLQVGLSNIVQVAPLPGIQLEVEGQNRILIRGISKEIVGLQAAKIRRVRPPDRYKGKGIRYVGELVQLKPGKGGRKA